MNRLIASDVLKKVFSSEISSSQNHCRFDPPTTCIWRGVLFLRLFIYFAIPLPLCLIIIIDRINAEDERLRRQVLNQQARETAYRRYSEQNAHSKTKLLAMTQKMEAGV